MASSSSPQLVQVTPTFSIHSVSAHEAKHIFKEIFLDNCYDGVLPPPGSSLQSPFIVDAGANIGLFSLYMKQKYPASRILAFEPIPLTHEVLRRNLFELHAASTSTTTTGEDGNGGYIKTYQTALGSKETTAKFTYYPSAPGNSTLFPDQKEGLKEVVLQKFPEHGALAMEKWLSGAEEVEVPVQRLSYFLSQLEGGCPEKIDLLKMDVEGGEFEVLGGLDEAHWGLVQNVVLEISDIRNPGALARMKGLLEGKGFVVEHGATHPDFSEEIFIVKARRV